MTTLATAYVPSGASGVLVLAAMLGGLVVVGYLVQRLAVRWARAIAWTSLVAGTAGVERLTGAEPPGYRMIAMISFVLLAMKGIVMLEEQARGLKPLSFVQWLGFAAGWIGMQPRLFASQTAAPLPGAGALMRRGLLCAISGAALVALARLTWTQLHARGLATGVLLTGLSLMLHFGVCNVLAGAWRFRGVACEALFRAPLRSTSLSEFWARRWNLAFSEMTAIAVYRPLSGRIGRGSALLGGFVLSGLLHELAISVPVRAGFGLPLAYFLLHGGLVLSERAFSRMGHPIDGLAGRAWVFFWVLVPLPILFHRPFLAGVIWPLIGVPGA